MSWRDWFRKKKHLADYLTPEEQARIVQAIQSAEGRTSGELRIHLEPRCRGDALQRAAALFDRLQMRKTREHNATLIYCALEDKKFALFGDAGVEKLHALIVQDHGRYYLEDNGTPGGTFINDARANGRTPLQSGDLIRMGKSVLRFYERQKRK